MIQEEYRSSVRSGVFRRFLNLNELRFSRPKGRRWRSGFDLSAATEPVEVQRSTERSRRSPKVEPEQGFQAPTEHGSVATFQAGSESLSQRHSELLNSSILNSFQALTNALVEMMVPIIEALPVVRRTSSIPSKREDLFFEQSETLTQKLPPTQKEEKLSTRVEIPTQDTSVLLPQKSGIDAVQEALGEMKEGSLKSLLQGMTTDMQATVPNSCLIRQWTHY
jgi:hypothetical protein